MVFRRGRLLILALLLLYPGPLQADAIVGDGTPESCTTAALVAALAGGGLITFNCGAAAVTITLEETLQVESTTTIDGGALVTFSGDKVRRVLEHTGGILTLQNLSIIDGFVSGEDTDANGAGIHSRYQGVPLALNIENVTFNSNISVLTGFTTGSASDYGGGAIYVEGTPVTIMDSTFTTNDSSNGAGGALHGLRSNALITGSIFFANTSQGEGRGGALFFDGAGLGSGTISISNSTFSNNTTFHEGGAIYVHLYQGDDTFTVDRSNFIANTVIGGSYALGGAISGGNGEVMITNSLFAHNHAWRPEDAGGSGGGVAFTENADITIANSTFYNNLAQGTFGTASGGGIYITNNSRQFRITNTTISRNHAGWIGGGIAGSSNGILRNTIIANNTVGNDTMIPQQCAAQLLNGGSNLQYPARDPDLPGDTNCANNITIAEPMLGELTDNGGPTQTLPLLLGSPAIDTGSNTICAASPINHLDQRGETRPIDGNGNAIATCDIGAYEYRPDISPFAPVLQTPSNNMSTLETSASFMWMTAPFAESYRLQVDNDANFSSPIINLGTTDTSFTPVFLLPGLYRWRVVAINENGETNSSVRTFTLISPPEAVPVQYLFDTATPTLSWLGREWAGGHYVQIAADPNFSTMVYNNNAIPAASTSVVPDPLQDGIYYWRVRMVLPNGRWSNWSMIQTFAIMVGVSSP